MVKKMTNQETNIIRFTNQISSVITLNNVSKQEFFNDITNLKDKKINFITFKNKYIQLFNGITAKYKNKESFLGSYRRNINPNYFSSIKDEKIKQFNQNLRSKTITIPNLYKKQILKQKVVKSEILKKETLKDKYESHIVYNGFAKKEILRLKNIQDIEKAKNLFVFQEVQLVVNFDTYFFNENGYRTIYQIDTFLTFASNVSTIETLESLFDIAYNKFTDFVSDLEQSNLYIEINSIYTHVYRHGNPKRIN